MNESYDVEMGQFFDVGDNCHYSFGAVDEVSSSELETYSRRWLQLWFEEFDGFDVYVANAS